MKKPKLAAGESVLWQKGANRAQGGQAVGGRLFLTDQRLVFEPNVIDRVTGGKTWAVDHADISGVGREKRSLSAPLSGGIRQRLKLSTSTGDQLFVVNKLDDVIPVLQERLGLRTDPNEA